MAGPELLAQPAYRYQFFQALRLLESALAGAPIGERGPYQNERLRLRPSTSLGFPTAEVVEVASYDGADGQPGSLVTTNLPGLYGSGSPLPRSYAHQILLEEDEQPQTRQFLDLLHHRLLSIWYRTWKHCRYEQSYKPDGSDLLSRALLDLLGISPETPEEEIGIAPVRLLRYLSLLLPRTRPVEGLQVLLTEELALPIVIEQAPERELVLPPEQWFRLASRPQDGGGCLGRDVVIGSRRIDRQSLIRLHIGPIPYSTFLQLVPSGNLLNRLIALCRFYLRQPLDLSLHVSVPASEVIRAKLGTAGGRLGWPVSAGPPRTDPVCFAISASLGRDAPPPRLSVLANREV